MKTLKNFARLSVAIIAVSTSSAFAASGTWSNTTSGGLWSATTNWSGGTVADGAGNTADFSTLNITANDTVHLDTARTIGNLTFGDTTPSNGWVLDNNGVATNILTLQTTTGVPTITTKTGTTTISLVMTGTQGASFVQGPGAAITLQGANTYTGTTSITGGTLLLDFANSGTFTSQLLYNGVTTGGLVMNAGTLNESNKTNTTSGQVFAGTTLNSGASVLTQNGRTSSAHPYINLGALTRLNGATVDITSQVGSGSSLTDGTTGYFTTTANGASGIIGGWATYNGGADWARNTGSAGTNGGQHIYGLGSASTAFNYVNSATTTGTTNLDMTASVALNATSTVGSVRFNTAAAGTTLTLSGTNIIGSGGILITPTVAANATSITGGVLTSGDGTDLIINNYDVTTGGAFNVSSSIANNGATAIGLTEAGSGTTTISGANTFTGTVTMNAGTLVLGNASALNTSTAGTPVNALVFANTGTATPAAPVVALNGNSAAVASISNFNSGGASTIENAIGTSVSSATITVNGSSTATYTGVLQDGTGGGTLAFAMSGTGTQALTGSSTFSGGTTLNNGTVAISTQANVGNHNVTFNGGTLAWTNTATQILATSSTLTVGAGGGTLNTNFGTNTDLILSGTNQLVGSGALTVTGGTTGALWLQQTNSYSGALTVGNGGLVEYGIANAIASAATVTANTGGTFAIDANAANNITLNGGTLLSNVASTTESGAITLGASGGNILENYWYIPTSSTLTLSGAIGGAGGLTVNGANLTGGVLNLSGVDTYSGNTTLSNNATVNITGAGQLGSGSYAGSITNNGNFNYNSSAAQTLSGAVTGTGSFAVGGTGTVTLASASNTYSGNTTVNSGGLILNNSSTGSGNVAVGTSTTAASFGGTGTSGAVTIGAHGTITPGLGQAAAGTLTVGSLTMAVGSSENLYLGAGNTDALIAVTTPGGLTLTGGTINVFDAGTANPANIAGVYNVIQYSGTFAGIGGLTTSSAPTGFTYALSNNGAGDIVLTVTANTVANLWNAANGGDWNTTSNWSSGTAAGGPNGAGVAAFLGVGQTVTSNGGNVNISGSVTVGSLTFTNVNSYNLSSSAGQSLTIDNSGSTGSITLTTGNHTISAAVVLASPGAATTVGSGETLTMSGNISGTGTLTVNGPGTTLLSGSNSYGPAAGTVGTVFNSGTLALGNNNALSTGDLSVTGNNTVLAAANNLSVANKVIVTNATTTTVDTNGNTLTLSGNVTDNGGTGSGTGSLTVASTTAGGVLVLTGASNNYGGVTTINSGATLQLGNATSGGSVGAGGITNNGALVGGEGTGNTVTVNSIISGAGTLTQSGAGTLVLNNANTFTGTTTINNGSLVVQIASALQNSTVNLVGGALNFGPTTTTGTLGALTGSANLVLNTNTTASAVALTTGGDNATTTFSGAISGKGSLTKVGTGTMTLTGANTYLGLTTVSAGLLNINNNLGTSAAPTGALSVGAGAAMNINNATVYASSFSTFNTGGGATVNITGTSTVTLSGALTLGNNGSNGDIVTLSGGALSANSATVTRTGQNYGAGTLAGAVDGLYINGGVFTDTTTLSIAGSNSGATMRMDSGTSTIGGTTTINDTGNNRVALLDINGGVFNSNDTTGGGIVIGGTGTNYGELLVRGTGVLNTNKITLGSAGVTIGNDVFDAIGGTTYIGSGGIVSASSGSATMAVNFGSGTVATAPVIGASADWSETATITLANASTGTGTPTTFQTGDANGVGHNITLSGVVTSGTTAATAGGLIKTGTGTLFLANAGNNYTGTTTLNAGTVQVSGVQNLGTNYSTMTFNGGTLRYNAGASGAGSTDITGGAVGTVSILAGGATIDTNGNTVDFSKTIGKGGSGGLTLNDTNATKGMLELDGINTYTGTTTINAGTLLIGDSSGTGLLASSGVNLTGSTAVLDISIGNSQTIQDLSGVAGSTVNLGLFNLTEGTANSTTFAGSIVDNGLGGGFTKQGSGTLTLTGASTYGGATTVANGKLRMNGSVTSVVTVGNNTATTAILSGTGTVGGLVTSTTGSNVAYIAPGTNTGGTRGDTGAAGTLNVGTLGFTIGAGTQFDYDLASANTVGSGVNDLITMNGGTLTIGGTGIVFNLNALSTLTTGVEYTLINGAGSISGFSASDFSATGIGSDTAVFSTTGGALQVELLGAAGPDYYYNGSTSTDFTNFANYSQTISGTPQTTALSSTSNVYISANSPSNNGPVVNSNVTINTLTFNSNGAGATISGTGTVTLAASGGVGITDAAGSSTGTETISAGVALGSNQSWATTANSTLRVSGSISGANSLVLGGAGTYRLSGSNTFSGLTVGNGSDTPTVYLANTTAGGSATGTTTFTVKAGATIGGKGTSSGTSFNIAGTGTSTAARANILVGQTSLTDINTTGVLTLKATGASTIADTNLNFNLDASGNSTQLNVGATSVAFGTDSVGSVKLTLNVQGEPSIIANNSLYTLIAGTGATSIASGSSTGQYTGLTLGTTTTLGNGATETVISGNNLQMAFGSAIDQSYYANGSYLVLYQSAGVDDIDVVVVPEPGTWAMMLGGLAVLAFWQRRRKASKI